MKIVEEVSWFIIIGQIHLLTSLFYSSRRPHLRLPVRDEHDPDHQPRAHHVKRQLQVQDDAGFGRRLRCALVKEQ